MTKTKMSIAAFVGLGLFASACQNRVVTSGGEKDSGPGQAPEPDYVIVMFGSPTGTTSNFPSSGILFSLLTQGPRLQLDLGRGDLITSLGSVTDLTTGGTLPTEVEVLDRGVGAGEKYKFTPVGGVKPGAGYRVDVTPHPSDPLVRVYWGPNHEVTKGSMHANVYTYSKPVIAGVGMGRRFGKLDVELGFSEDYRLAEMISAPRPVLLFDDVEVEACVDPIVECVDVGYRSYKKLPIGEDGADVEVGSTLHLYLPEDHGSPVQKITITLPKDVRGISATFEEAIEGIPNAVVVGEFVEYTFFIRDATFATGNEYTWVF